MWNGNPEVKDFDVGNLAEIDVLPDGKKFRPYDNTFGEVTDDQDNFLYHTVGSNVLDETDGKYKSSVIDIIPGQPQDNAKFKSTRTRYKTGWTDEEWHFGLKTRNPVFQYLAKAVSIVGLPDKTTPISSGTVIENAQAPLLTGKKLKNQFQYAELEYDKNGGTGGKVIHNFDPQIAIDEPHNFYVLVWEANDIGIVNFLEADVQNGCSFITDGLLFGEVFSRNVFFKEDKNGVLTSILKSKYSHNYTTLSGSIGTTVFSTGTTYYFSSDVTLNAGASAVFRGSSDDPLVIKTVGTASLRFPNAGCQLKTQNFLTDNQYAIFTSKNDDSVGEAISGSSGSPATGDQSAPYIEMSGDNNEYWCEKFSFRYCESNGVFAYINSSDTSGVETAIDNFDYKYCRVTNAAATVSSFLGKVGTSLTVGCGKFVIRNVSIDDTNECTAANSLTRPICMTSSSTGVLSYMENISLYMTTSNYSQGIQFTTLGDDAELKGCLIDAASTISGVSAIQIYAPNGCTNIRADQNTIEGSPLTPAGTSYGISISIGGSQTVTNAYIQNNLLRNLNGGSDYGLITFGASVTVTNKYNDYNHFYDVDNEVGGEFSAIGGNSTTGTDWSFRTGASIGASLLSSKNLDLIDTDTFESTLESWAAGGSGAITRVTTSPHSGSYCAQLVGGGDPSYIYKQFTAPMGSIIYVDMWVYNVSGGSTVLYALSRTAGDFTDFYSNSVSAVNVWSNIIFQVITPIDNPYISILRNSGTVRIDDVKFYIATNPELRPDVNLLASPSSFINSGPTTLPNSLNHFIDEDIYSMTGVSHVGLNTSPGQYLAFSSFGSEPVSDIDFRGIGRGLGRGLNRGIG